MFAKQFFNSQDWLELITHICRLIVCLQPLTELGFKINTQNNNLDVSRIKCSFHIMYKRSWSNIKCDKVELTSECTSQAKS